MSRSDRVSGIGLWPASALVIGHTIAIGIFLTPAEVIGALASPGLTLALWIACGAAVLAGALAFGELAARYPEAGGPYIYLREAWGERAASLYGWQSLLVMDPGVTAALATGLSQYLVIVWPAAAGGERWVAVAAIWTLSAVAAAGLTLSARVLLAITVLKLLACGGVVAAAFAAAGGSLEHFQPFFARRLGAPPLGDALAAGLVSVFFAFGGFWEANRVAGEVDDARRTLPAALSIGVVVVTAVYLATTAAFIYLVPVGEVTSAAAFGRRAGQAMLGPAGPAVLASVVVVSAAASILALVIMAPRLYVAMSRDRLFPAAVAALHPQRRAPVRATVLLASAATLYALFGTFEQIVAFFMCTTLTFIALAAGALLVVPRKARVAGVESLLVPAAILFMIVVAAVVVLVAARRPGPALGGAAVVLAGWMAHRMLR